MLNSFSLKKRFWLSFCLFWLVIILCTIVGVVGLVSARDSLRLVHQDKMETVNLLHDLSENFQDTRSHIFRAFQHNPASDLHLLHNHDVIDHINSITANQQKNKTLRDQLSNRTVNADESVLREAVFTALNNWRVKLDLVTKGIAVENYSNDLMFLFLTAGREEGAEVESSLRVLANYQNTQADIAATAAEKRYKDSVILLLLLYALLAGPASAFMVLSLRRLSHGLASVEYAADAIAKGDLTHEIFLSGNDEMTRVNSKIIVMQENLTQLISGIRSSTYDIEAGISFLAEASANLGDRNNQQAASLEETSAATEELNGTVELNADNARQAEHNAEEANAVAIRGGQVVQGVVSTMGKINDSSVHIAEIVSIIDSIAFQTNILALNAAVEAARAGEQGRGFAVVASEVRALAQRSASAASEIKDLVEESINVVTEGGSQVKNAGDTMQDIVNSNAKLAALIREISSASQEQVIGLSQINQAILLMDTATHQNNELASSTSNITAQLHNQAEHLLELVSTFRLKSVPQTPRKLNNTLT